MMGKILTDFLNFSKDYKLLNKGGDLKKREKNRYFLKAISVSKEVPN